LEKDEGKRRIEQVVTRFMDVLKKNALERLSEQDVTTKFVLPMLQAFGWNVYKVTEKGPEIHEKAYREKSDVGKGLPDIMLKSENGTVFVEVKKPPLRSYEVANLERYGDADLIVLTSFEDLRIYTRFQKQKPRLRIECNYKEYVKKFDKLWDLLSNTTKGKRTRAAYKATR
jgi:hypothetical protein